MIPLKDFIKENTMKKVIMPSSAFNTLDECLDLNNVFTYDGISRKNIVEILTDYRDFKNYKEGDDTSEFTHKKLN